MGPQKPHNCRFPKLCKALDCIWQSTTFLSCYSSSETAPTIDDLCMINGLDWGLGQEGLYAFQCCVCTCIWNSSNFASFVEQYSPRSPYSKGKDDSCSPICGWDSVLAAQQTHLMPVLCNYRDYGEETKAARGKLRHEVQEKGRPMGLQRTQMESQGGL
jgi:hypothetical protein